MRRSYIAAAPCSGVSKTAILLPWASPMLICFVEPNFEALLLVHIAPGLLVLMERGSRPEGAVVSVLAVRVMWSMAAEAVLKGVMTGPVADLTYAPTEP